MWESKIPVISKLLSYEIEFRYKKAFKSLMIGNFQEAFKEIYNMCPDATFHNILNVKTELVSKFGIDQYTAILGHCNSLSELIKKLDNQLNRFSRKYGDIKKIELTKDQIGTIIKQSELDKDGHHELKEFDHEIIHKLSKHKKCMDMYSCIQEFHEFCKSEWIDELYEMYQTAIVNI